jgi:bacterioferritin
MKGNQEVIDKLNELLAEELTAINQYMVHAEMAEDWGYTKLYKDVYERAILEMKHAEKLIERILYLEGRPIVSNLLEIKIGPEVPKQLENDLSLEYFAVKHYNEAVKLCVDKSDNGTKEIVEAILRDEEGHVDDIESKQDQMSQMGTELFLSTLK